jgi:hypothetical protein
VGGVNALAVLEQELHDALEYARRRRRQPLAQAPVIPLARDIVGDVRPAPIGICTFCGALAPGRSVCPAHDDLTELDDGTSAVVTHPTTGGKR